MGLYTNAFWDTSVSIWGTNGICLKLPQKIAKGYLHACVFQVQETKAAAPHWDRTLQRN